MTQTTQTTQTMVRTETTKPKQPDRAMLMDSLGWDQATAQNLRFLKAIGVECVRVDVPAKLVDGQDHTEDFRRVRETVEGHGIELVALHGRGIPKDKIVYGREGREEQLNAWIATVRAIGAAGVPMTGLTFQPIGHFRTTRTVGRGGALLSTWNMEEYSADPKKFAREGRRGPMGT